MYTFFVHCSFTPNHTTSGYNDLLILVSQDHFKVNPDTNLTPAENAITHAVTMMLENHTAVAGFNWRYGYNNGEFCDKVIKIIRINERRLFRTRQ